MWLILESVVSAVFDITNFFMSNPDVLVPAIGVALSIGLSARIIKASAGG